jgi:subtilase family serine protease
MYNSLRFNCKATPSAADKKTTEGKSRTEGEVMLRRFSLTIVALLSIATSICHAQSPTLLTRHVREVTLNGRALLVGRLPETQIIRLTLALPLRNQEVLDSFLQELYDPSSSSYRQFLTVEQFTEKFGPTQEDYDTVIRFAEESGLQVATSRNRVNVDVTGSVASIERALHVTLGLYQHPTENRTFYAPDREPTPDVSVRLWHISGLDNYSIPRPTFVHHSTRAKSNATTGSGPSASFLGSDMRAAYYGGTLTGSGQSLGLLEYAGTDLADLNTYYKNVGQTNNVPITLSSTDGTSTSCTYPSCDDTEQTIDMTQALGMAPGLSSLVVYVGSSDAPIFNAMATASPLNGQLSSSWTWSPADPSTDNPYFKEFAAQGQNLFQAAGDSGRWTPSSEIYPADDVYVTSVGGTDLETASAGGPWASETAWVDGGGGISPDTFAIPSWQTATASGCSSCSQTYRNGPDVSANANFTFYVCADQEACTANEYGGSSFATPMWAGYLALVNEQSVANGNKMLGFINPSLYTIGLSSNYDSDFHDITSGSNGYPATTGYDLATGWGSPNGSGLLNALAGSSTPSFTLASSPSSLTITQGGSGRTSTITLANLGGFSGSVTLAASGLPSGVTATFSTNPTTSTSTLTLTASSTATTGTATVTITGTSGSLTAITTVSLTVNAASSPNFSLSASPTSMTITQGSSGASTITITSTGSFNSATTLSATGLPSGVTATFSTNPVTPPANGSMTSTLTLTASSSASTGTAALTITGVSGSITQTTTIALTVNASSGAKNFTLSLSPSSFTIDDRGNVSTTLTVTSVNGFNSAVELSVNEFPSGVSATATANPLTPPANGTATVTITWSASRRAPSGTTTIELIGTSGSLSDSIPVTITVAR